MKKNVLKKYSKTLSLLELGAIENVDDPFQRKIFKPKVMIVDDDPICREHAQILLGTTCECIAFPSGAEAVAAFIETFKNSEKKFDVVLLDYEMPKMNGIGVITELRKSEASLHIKKEDYVKIIIMTKHQKRKVVLDCIKAGCDHYFLKPLTFDKIQEKFKSLNIIPSRPSK